jgi:hypothetical protein
MSSKPRAVVVWSVLVGCMVVIGCGLLIASCQSQRRLVEVFDNGPVGGPSGPSEGYIWVGKDDLPPPGKSWKSTDPNTLTADQRQRIR